MAPKLLPRPTIPTFSSFFDQRYIIRSVFPHPDPVIVPGVLSMNLSATQMHAGLIGPIFKQSSPSTILSERPRSSCPTHVTMCLSSEVSENQRAVWHLFWTDEGGVGSTRRTTWENRAFAEMIDVDGGRSHSPCSSSYRPSRRPDKQIELRLRPLINTIAIATAARFRGRQQSARGGGELQSGRSPRWWLG